MDHHTPAHAGSEISPTKRRLLSAILGFAPAAAVAAALPKTAVPVALASRGPLARDRQGNLWIILQKNVKENRYGGGVSPGGQWHLVERPDGGIIFDDYRCCLVHRDSLQEVCHGAV